MQIIEYLRAFLMGRIGLSRHNLLLIVSGAFGVFSKRWVIEAGGYSHTVGEDMELVVRLHRLIKQKKPAIKLFIFQIPYAGQKHPMKSNICEDSGTAGTVVYLIVFGSIKRCCLIRNTEASE